MKYVSLNESQLVRTIKAHIAKGDHAAEKSEQHYISAGQHLKTLKSQHEDAGGTWAQWESILREKIGIGKSRASELMQIADGRKTVERVRTETAERTAKTRALRSSPLRSGENAGDPEASAELMKAEFAALDVQDQEADKAVTEEHDSVTAALRMVEQMSEEDRENFFDEIEDHYRDDWGYRIHENESDSGVVHTIVGAIGAERAKALARKMPRLVSQAVGKAALPDCLWCGGSGLMDGELFGNTLKVPCTCIRRKRGEDFETLRARLEREDKERQIPQQDFSFGLEATTKDGKVWASGVRLATKEEAEFYVDYWARSELRAHGYATWRDDPAHPCDVLAFDIKRYDEQPRMKITGGSRKTLNFQHGTCGLLGWNGWRPISGGQCECKKCNRERERREADERLAERFNKEREIVERALAAGEISQEQYAEWWDLPVNRRPEWLARLMRSQPVDGLDIPASLRRTA
jgi:hypothetical protein